FAALPGVELSVGTALVPGAGVALFVKGMIQGRIDLVAALVALGAMLCYAAAALALAARIYTSEETLAEGAGAAGGLAARVRSLPSGLSKGWRVGVLPMQTLAGDMKRSRMRGPRPLAFDLFVVGISPAVCEELLFRGAILSGLRRALHPWTAAIACGALFGVFH